MGLFLELVALPTSFILGAVVLFGVMVWKIWTNDDKDTLFDDSNVHNPVRVITSTVLHPKDLNRQFILPDEAIKILKDAGYQMRSVYWYIDKDEFSQVVKTRPQSSASMLDRGETGG